MYKFLFGDIQLPVAPEKISMKVKGKNETIELVNGREKNFLRFPALTEFSFDFLIPAVKYPFAEYPEGFKGPDFYMEMLEYLMKEKTKFRFSILRTFPDGRVLFETNMMVSLESYSTNEEGFDTVASVELKQYDEGVGKKYVVNGTENGKIIVTEEKQRSSDRVPPKEYTVKKGDTLWAICKKELGSGDKWPEIVEINNIENPNFIYPGQVIKLG